MVVLHSDYSPYLASFIQLAQHHRPMPTMSFYYIIVPEFNHKSVPLLKHMGFLFAAQFNLLLSHPSDVLLVLYQRPPQPITLSSSTRRAASIIYWNGSASVTRGQQGRFATTKQVDGKPQSAYYRHNWIAINHFSGRSRPTNNLLLLLGEIVTCYG